VEGLLIRSKSILVEIKNGFNFLTETCTLITCLDKTGCSILVSIKFLTPFAICGSSPGGEYYGSF